MHDIVLLIFKGRIKSGRSIHMNYTMSPTSKSGLTPNVGGAQMKIRDLPPHMHIHSS